MLKKFASVLCLLISAYLLGFYTRGVLEEKLSPPEPVTEPVLTRSPAKPPLDPAPVTLVETPPESAPIPAVEPPPIPIEDELILAEVPYDPSDAVKRLQALEKVRYNVPGSAFTRMVDDVFDESDNISASMSAVMELSLAESDRFNELLDDAVARIREIETQAVHERIEPNGDVVLVIPAFEESGAEIRRQLLSGIEGELGSDRRHIFEMMLLQKPSSFGNFGGAPMAVRNPVFETVNGWREIVTIDIGKILDAGTADERFEGVRKAYQRDAFLKRFGHFFEFEADDVGP